MNLPPPVSVGLATQDPLNSNSSLRPGGPLVNSLAPAPVARPPKPPAPMFTQVDGMKLRAPSVSGNTAPPNQAASRSAKPMQQTSTSTSINSGNGNDLQSVSKAFLQGAKTKAFNPLISSECSDDLTVLQTLAYKSAWANVSQSQTISLI